MIVFDGVSMSGVGNVKIDDIRVSPIRLNPVSRQRAIQWGSEFVRMGGVERTVTVTFALLDSNRASRAESLLWLSDWAKTDKEYILELDEVPTRYLQCVCTGKPEPSTRQWWENRLRLTFTCFSNPYWTSKAEKTATCGTAFTVGGNVQPLMRIERTVSGSAASNQSYSDGTNTMTFTTIPVGNMVIDLNSQTAAVGSSSIMQYYQPSGRFVVPKVGSMTITGTGSIKYRERWE